MIDPSKFFPQRLMFEIDTPRALAVKKLLKLPDVTIVVFLKLPGANRNGTRLDDIEIGWYYLFQEFKILKMAIGGRLMMELGYDRAFGHPLLNQAFPEFGKPAEHLQARIKIHLSSIEMASITFLELVYEWIESPVDGEYRWKIGRKA
jgi:hypothetical protein